VWVISGVLATIIGIVVTVGATVIAVVALTDSEWSKATAYLLLALLAAWTARGDK